MGHRGNLGNLELDENNVLNKAALNCKVWFGLRAPIKTEVSFNPANGSHIAITTCHPDKLVASHETAVLIANLQKVGYQVEIIS